MNKHTPTPLEGIRNSIRNLAVTESDKQRKYDLHEIADSLQRAVNAHERLLSVIGGLIEAIDKGRLQDSDSRKVWRDLLNDELNRAEGKE